jgi:hypothetical protein
MTASCVTTDKKEEGIGSKKAQIQNYNQEF